MAIQNRRGNSAKLDTNKLLPGELAVSLDSRQIFACLSAGDVAELSTREGMLNYIDSQISDLETSAANARAIYDLWKGTAVGDFSSQIMKLQPQYGYFLDSRTTATTGYWHKLFEIKNSGYSNTDTNFTLNVQPVLGNAAAFNYLTNGILRVAVRQGTNGAITTAYTYAKWTSASHNIGKNLNRFAINVIPASTGNIVEFYVYNNVQYGGFRVNVIDSSSSSTGQILTFTGYTANPATTTLTTLPTTGTIVYSTLGENMGDMSKSVYDTDNTGTVDNSEGLKITAITSGQDLNSIVSDYTKVSAYQCPQNATVATLSNCPTADAFSLMYYPTTSTTSSKAGGAQFLQTYRVGSDKKIYHRTAYEGSWGSWSEIYRSDTMPSASTGAKGFTQLYDGVDSTSTALAPTANAVRKAYVSATQIEEGSLSLVPSFSTSSFTNNSKRALKNGYIEIDVDVTFVPSAAATSCSFSGFPLPRKALNGIFYRVESGTFANAGLIPNGATLSTAGVMQFLLLNINTANGGQWGMALTAGQTYAFKAHFGFYSA